MPPIWLCPDCEGVAYGWARGPCIYCGSDRFVSTDPSGILDERPSEFRLIFFTEKAWAQLEAEAIIAGKSPPALVAEREGAEVVLSRKEPVDHGQLVLLKAEPEKSQAHR
jgi:hypothetical protein